MNSARAQPEHVVAPKHEPANERSGVLGVDHAARAHRRRTPRGRARSQAAAAACSPRLLPLDRVAREPDAEVRLTAGLKIVSRDRGVALGRKVDTDRPTSCRRRVSPTSLTTWSPRAPQFTRPPVSASRPRLPLYLVIPQRYRLLPKAKKGRNDGCERNPVSLSIVGPPGSCAGCHRHDRMPCAADVGHEADLMSACRVAARRCQLTRRSATHITHQRESQPASSNPYAADLMYRRPVPGTPVVADSATSCRGRSSAGSAAVAAELRARSSSGLSAPAAIASRAAPASAQLVARRCGPRPPRPHARRAGGAETTRPRRSTTSRNSGRCPAEGQPLRQRLGGIASTRQQPLYEVLVVRRAERDPSCRGHRRHAGAVTASTSGPRTLGVVVRVDVDEAGGSPPDPRRRWWRVNRRRFRWHDRPSRWRRRRPGAARFRRRRCLRGSRRRRRAYARGRGGAVGTDAVGRPPGCRRSPTASCSGSSSPHA